MAKQLTTLRLVDKHTLAEQLSCSWRHLENLTRAGIIPHVRLGKLVRYDLSAVEQALTRLAVNAQPKSLTGVQNAR